jgi:murein DD-endopeptidase MepM/ murein hydrolase activator NlpD
MEPSDDSQRDSLPHRPLPSVDIAILRDDVRARQQKILLSVAAVAFGLAGLVAALVYASGGGAEPTNGGSEPTATAEATASPAVPTEVGYTPPVDAGRPEEDARVVAPPIAIAVESGVTRTTHVFGRASGFRPALTTLGVGAEDGDAITAALASVMDFRRCRPEHQLILERDPSGQIQRFEYRASITQIYEARREPASARFEGRAIPVPVERARLARGGPVQSSLGAALEAAGLGRTLVGVFVETFEGQIDFNTETRAGDAFRIVVDEERIEGQFLRYGTIYALEYRSRRRGVLRAFWAETPSGGDFHDENGRAVHGGWLRTPLRYDHISSPFNPRRMHPVLRRIMPHTGVDYSAGTGTPVWSAAEGVVTFVGPKGANGNLVSIRHESGYETFYCHLSRFERGLAAGQTVRQRQVIGYVGTTGRSTGPHLHFGLKRNGDFVDPIRELNGPGRILPQPALGRFRAQVPALVRELERIEIPTVELPGAPAVDAPQPAAEDAMD